MLNLLPRDEKYFDRFSDMARRIHESARILNGFFGGEAPVAPVADQIKRLEHHGDVAYHEAVASLFSEQIAPIEVIKWKDIYDNMERCIDQAEAVAHVLESVVLKHS